MNKEVKIDRTLQVADKVVLAIGVLSFLALSAGIMNDTIQYQNAKKAKIENIANNMQKIR